MSLSTPPAPISEEIIYSPNTAPFAKLPNELLAEIFKFSAPIPFVIPWRPDERGLPWTLLRVSKKWRSIALELPELWSNVFIDYGGQVSLEGKTSDPELVTRMAHEILSRSRNVPLFLWIEAVTYDWETVDRWAHLGNLIALHAHRTRYLDLYLHEKILCEVLESPPYDFDCLQFLSLASTDDEWTEKMSRVFQNAPLLWVVELDLRFVWSLATPRLAWANLAHLSITRGDDLSPIIAHRVIRQCPSLITLQITLWSDDLPMDRDVPLMTFPSLQTLLVEVDGCTTVAEFLQSLVLPRLTRLELTPSDDFPHAQIWDHAAALSAISNYQMLDNLMIALPIPDDYNMGPLFKPNSNLVELRLPPLSQTTLLLLSSGSGTWLPKLQILEVPVTSESLYAHAVMLNNRAEGGLSTRGILIWSTQRDREEFQAKANGAENLLIKKLRNRGLLRLASQSREYADIRDFIPAHMSVYLELMSMMETDVMCRN